MSNQQLGILIAGAGLVVVLAGLVVWAGGMAWFGHLPGDIRIERGNVTVFIPIGSMLLISVVLSLLFTVLRRLF